VAEGRVSCQAAAKPPASVTSGRALKRRRWYRGYRRTGGERYTATINAYVTSECRRQRSRANAEVCRLLWQARYGSVGRKQWRSAGRQFATVATVSAAAALQQASPLPASPIYIVGYHFFFFFFFHAMLIFDTTRDSRAFAALDDHRDIDFTPSAFFFSSSPLSI